MFAVWLHTVGARIIALPFRIVIGLVFINQGYLNMQARAAENSQLLLNLEQYGLGGVGSTGVGLLLILAGIAAIVGIFVRVIGGLLFVVVITNLFAGLAASSDMITVLQNRMLLAMCSLLLFFLGSGVLSFDNLIFKGVNRALRKSDEEAIGKARRGR